MTPHIVCMFGRQPALGLAELESLFGAEHITPMSHGALLAADRHDFPFSRLGGTVKAGKLLTFLPYTDWDKIAGYLIETLPQHIDFIPEGKIRLGLSVYGMKVPPRRINATGLSLKKIVKAAGRSVRVVPNTTFDLNAAQVIHNQLTGPTGLELMIIKDDSRTVLAQTIAVQDIDAYAARDQARPMRDSKVGMLPPKLAQTIINLANPAEGDTVLDPFCGTGVVLQEAQLMGFDTYGTDLEERMIEYSEKNIEWFQREHYPKGATWRIEQADATSYQWRHKFNTIACETYLGRPFSNLPAESVLHEVIQDVNLIHKKFLKNLATQTKPGFRACIAVPAWHMRGGFKHLPVLDQLEDLGYTRTSFVHVDNSDLIYHRPDQIVARELVVLTRK